MSDEPRKRSRFDQTEPEPARKSRFDRRSRSPAGRKDSESHRSRSPIRSGSDGSPGDKKSAAAAAAAAAAAKINASINAKKGIQHVDVPPIRATQSPTSAGGAKSPTGQQGDIYQQDGDFIKDIEVNDLRNRYTLTKGSTQKMIKEKTGADVTTRGNYYPDKSMATAANPPLYLHVTSVSKEGLEKAIQEINDLMQQELPDLVDQRRFQRGRREPEPNVERDSYGRRKWPEERIPVELEPIPGFNLRAQVVGQGGQNVKYIQQETKCRVQIKGRGSGFMEQDTGMESDEQMYLHVAGPDPAMVQQAKEMALGLLDTVKQNYLEFKENGPPNRGGNDRNQGYDRGGQRGSYHERDRNGSGSYGGNEQYGNNGQDQYGYGYAGQPPQTPTIVPFGSGAALLSQAAAALQAQGLNPGEIEQWAAYYAANPTYDPFVSVGGYGYYMAYFAATGQYPGQQPQGGAGSPQQQGQQGYGGYGQSQSPANGAQAPPPPPPPPPPDDDIPPPPPPPPGAGGNAYNAVPPPPGM